MIGYRYKAKNIRVIDGDTVEAELDLGFKLHTRDIYRLAEINCKERDQPSTDYLKSLIDGKEVIIESHKPEKHGRWLAVLWVVTDGGLQSANQMMMDAGHAVPYGGGKR